MAEPLVSVLLPVRNGGPHLRDAVRSILSQTLDDFELLLVDDASSDGAIEALGMDDPRLRRLHSPGRGLVTALNYAAFEARGRYLARMDADDVALPERLERQVELLVREPGVGIAGAQVEIFADRGVGEGYRVYQAWINALCSPETIGREIFIESPIPHPTALFSKTLFRTLGGYRDVPWPEDYDLWLRAHLHGVRMAKPDGILLRWRDHDQRLSRADRRYAVRAFTAAKAHYLARSRLQGRQAVIWGAAQTGARLHDALRDEGIEVAAFIDIDPKKVGGLKRGVPVLPPEAAPDLAPALILGAVRVRGARQEIRDALEAMHLEEGWDYLFAA